MLLILIIAQWLAITVLLLVLMAALIFFIYKRCRLRRLTEDDAKAFETFKEVYKRRQIDIEEELFAVQRDVECGCLENISAVKPAESWSTARRHLGSNFDAVVQIAEKIDEALLEYQHRVASNEGMSSAGVPTEVVRKFGASYPHYPSFIVAQEWRDWANQTTAQFHGLEAQNSLLEEVSKRLAWVESVELGLADPGITDLHESYGWDHKRLSLLEVFTKDVTPQLLELRTTIDRSILEQSHAEVFKACFNLTKRLMVESMRFFECVVHTETLRVKSFTVDYENALPEELWDFTLKFLTEAEEDQRLLGDAAQSKAYARFQKMNHLDRCLSVWYVYMRPQLLERVTPEETSRDSWESLLEANRRFENFFQQLHYGFDYGTYLQEDGMLEEREPLRRRHFEGLKGSLSASTLCLEEEKFQRLLDILSFFMSRTLFATNQMANICLLQSSLSLLTGRLYINRLLSKKHILCSIMFMNSVIDQLRSQVQEIKEISLTGWQRARRKMRTSHWANTRPLDNFRMAMQAKKNLDKILDDLEFILAKVRDKVTSVTLKSGKDLREEKDKHMLLYALTWRNITSWQQNAFAPVVADRIAPSWAQEFEMPENLQAENMLNYASYLVCEQQWLLRPKSIQSLAMVVDEDEGDAGQGDSPAVLEPPPRRDESCPLLLCSSS